jgi:hypothetical protein
MRRRRAALDIEHDALLDQPVLAPLRLHLRIGRHALRHAPERRQDGGQRFSAPLFEISPWRKTVLRRVLNAHRAEVCVNRQVPRRVEQRVLQRDDCIRRLIRRFDGANLLRASGELRWRHGASTFSRVHTFAARQEPVIRRLRTL